MQFISSFAKILRVTLLLAGLCFVGALPGRHSCALAASAPALESIKSDLKKEQGKAQQRRESLKRLTSQERELYQDLAAGEKRILSLENNLEEQQKKLSELAKSSESVTAEYEKLLAERQRTESALRELLRALWELQSRRDSIGGRDLEAWPEADREYVWSAEMFEAIDAYRGQIAAQEKELNAVVAKGNALGQEIAERMEGLEKEKTKLLGDRVRYEQKLSSVRRQKEDAEAELSAALELIDSLNFNLKSAATASQDISKAKGSLPWPTRGDIRLKYQPGANPPVRGWGFATLGNAEVRAVHWGKVVFNDTMRGLGQVVVLQHGGEYFSVYAFLAENAVKLGQDVSAGQKLGNAGYYPAIKGTGLYFELRFHQKAINPEGWLSAGR